MDFKKLTAQEVASKRFTPVRMREGYSIDEVDEFLESVENTFNSYNDENAILVKTNEELRNRPAPVAANPTELADLKTRLEATLRDVKAGQALNQSLQGTVEQIGSQLVEARSAIDAAVEGRIAAEAGKTDAEAATVKAIESANNSANKPMDIASASGAVARMLETAAKNYDELVAQGEEEAKRVKDVANSEASEIRQKAEKEASQKLAEASAARDDAFAAIETEKHSLEEAVQSLRAIESRSREELLRVYSLSLSELQNAPLITDSSDTPSRAAGSRRAAQTAEAHGSPAFASVPSFNG